MSRHVVKQAVVSGTLTVCFGSLILATISEHLVVNITPSDHLGLYWCRPLFPGVPLRHGDRVIFAPPPWVQAEVRRVALQIPGTRAWMKTIAAVPGEMVCVEKDYVTIGGVWRAARPLLQDNVFTTPQGCVTLAADTYFVLNSHPRSFDSRYIGAISRASIQSTATPLLTWEARP